MSATPLVISRLSSSLSLTHSSLSQACSSLQCSFSLASADGSLFPAPADGITGSGGAGFGGVGSEEETIVLRSEERTEIDHNVFIADIEKIDQITEHEKVTDVHGIEMLCFKMRYSETLIAFLKMSIFHWQLVGHTAAKRSLVSAE